MRIARQYDIPISDNILNSGRCPTCGGDLVPQGSRIRCVFCKARYRVTTVVEKKKKRHLVWDGKELHFQRLHGRRK